MKIVKCDQRTFEWEQARLGIPTTSQFDRILTPKTRKPSSARDAYLAELLGDWLSGQPEEQPTSGPMDRGIELEPEARNWYIMRTGKKVKQIGFVMRDDGLVGGSPDGIVSRWKGLEIKCPEKRAKHILFMRGKALEHIGQCQGLMWLTGRTSWDVVSYHPDLPAVIQTEKRDKDYIKALVPVLDEFIKTLEAEKKKYAHLRTLRPWSPEIQEEMAKHEQRR